MNRNANSRFAVNPTNIDMPRSKFSRPQSIKTSFNVGDIIPFYLEEVLPGDTHSIDTSLVCRMQPLVAPIMDNVNLDTYYFFVPNRLVWEHWKQFMGENTDSAWIPETEYSIPQITSPANGWNVGTIADYLGIPTGIENLSVSALPFRAYALIMNEWFRDQNLTDPLNIPINDSTLQGSNGSNYVNDVALGGKPFKAAKYFDYFTGALPAPQKGPEVSINISDVPVVGNGYNVGLTYGGTSAGGLFNDNGLKGLTGYLGRTPQYIESSVSPWTGKATIGVLTEEQARAQGDVAYTGLKVADEAQLITINQLRQAFQIQKFYEKSARGGTRYIELLKSMFGVTSPDARLQRPEYLGGQRIPININQVVQTSESGNTPQGNTAAFSLTTNIHSDFTRSFVEHGYIIGVMVARYDHSYQQGIERTFSRKTRFDYYWPLFANLGEQAILNKEIYAQGSLVINDYTNTPYDDEVFGYQEAWADYRYKPNKVTGEMRSQYAQSLDSWHLADDYQSMPYLSDQWIREDKTNLDRALAVTSEVSNQLFADIYVKNISVRPMPIYSIPGLIDHH